MSETLEAVVDQFGNISLLTKVRSNGRRRAIVTILDEDSVPESATNVRPPSNDAVRDDDVLNVWSNRKDSAQKIADDLRQANRKIT